jgi:hypothetical protein
VQQFPHLRHEVAFPQQGLGSTCLGLHLVQKALALHVPGPHVLDDRGYLADRYATACHAHHCICHSAVKSCTGAGVPQLCAQLLLHQLVCKAADQL